MAVYTGAAAKTASLYDITMYPVKVATELSMQFKYTSETRTELLSQDSDAFQ